MVSNGGGVLADDSLLLPPLPFTVLYVHRKCMVYQGRGKNQIGNESTGPPSLFTRLLSSDNAQHQLDIYMGTERVKTATPNTHSLTHTHTHTHHSLTHTHRDTTTTTNTHTYTPPPTTTHTHTESKCKFQKANIPQNQSLSFFLLFLNFLSFLIVIR